MQPVISTLTPNGGLQAAFLTVKENVELQKALKLEYAKIDYACFVNEILFKMNNSNAAIALTMCDDLLFMLNKVLLDNIFRHVANRTPHLLLGLLANKMFGKDIYINPFYVSQIIEDTGIQIEDKTELENLITYRLQIYIDNIYVHNADVMNAAITAMFEVMYNNLQHINFGFYKFELMNYVQPILLYTERLHENYLYS